MLGGCLIIYIVFSQRLKSPSLRKMISEDLVMLTHPNAAWAAFACDFCRALVRRQVCRWIKMKRNNFAFQVSNSTAFCDLWCCYLWNAYATWSHWFISRFDARLDVLYKVMNSAIPPTPVMMDALNSAFCRVFTGKVSCHTWTFTFWCYLIYYGDIRGAIILHGINWHQSILLYLDSWRSPQHWRSSPTSASDLGAQWHHSRCVWFFMPSFPIIIWNNPKKMGLKPCRPSNKRYRFSVFRAWFSHVTFGADGGWYT